jgi:hypothetical protein
MTTDLANLKEEIEALGAQIKDKKGSGGGASKEEVAALDQALL